jgi:hypothetical protein
MNIAISKADLLREVCRNLVYIVCEVTSNLLIVTIKPKLDKRIVLDIETAFLQPHTINHTVIGKYIIEEENVNQTSMMLQLSSDGIKLITKGQLLPYSDSVAGMFELEDILSQNMFSLSKRSMLRLTDVMWACGESCTFQITDNGQIMGLYIRDHLCYCRVALSASPAEGKLQSLKFNNSYIRNIIRNSRCDKLGWRISLKTNTLYIVEYRENRQFFILRLGAVLSMETICS